MNYPGNIFYDLMDRATADGAGHADAICKARTYTVDTGQRAFKGDDGKEVVINPRGKAERVTLGSCAQSALFRLPYENPDDDLVEVTVCAVDDAMGAFPRFGGDRLARMSQRELFYVHGDRLEKNDPRVLGR